MLLLQCVKRVAVLCLCVLKLGLVLESKCIEYRLVFMCERAEFLCMLLLQSLAPG